MNKFEYYIKRFDTVFAFLGIEILVLACFGLGGLTGANIFRFIGFVLAGAMVPYILANHSLKELKGYLSSLAPLFIVALLSGLSGFTTTLSSGFATIMSDVGIFLGAIGFFVLAIAMKHNKAVKMDWILLAIGGSIALLVLVTTIYSLARYGFFYTAIYNDKFYYWDGSRFPIYSETKTLFGFSFLEASLSYSCFFGFILAAILPTVLFVSPKEDPKRFYTILGLGLIGLLSLIVLPYRRGLLLLIPIYAFGVIYRFIKHKKEVSKTLGIGGYVLAALVIIGILVLTVDSFRSDSFLAKIPFIGRYLGNAGFLRKIENNIAYTFFNENGGIDFASLLFGNVVKEGFIKNASISALLSDSFEFNFMWQHGFVAFMALVIVIFQCFIWGRNYLVSEQGHISGRIAPVLMLLAIFVYVSVFDDEMPFAHASTVSFTSMVNESRYMLVFFLIGLIYCPKVTGQPAKEEISAPAAETIKKEDAPIYEEVALDEE